MIVGYESGDEQILKNIKKGATIDMAKRFTADAHKLGLVIHGDFIVGLPGETHETMRKTIDFAKGTGRRNHSGFARPRLSRHRVLRHAEKNGLVGIVGMQDGAGHQLPNAVYNNFTKGDLVEWVERFYGEYYFRPKTAWRVVKKAVSEQRSAAALQRSARVPDAPFQTQTICGERAPSRKTVAEVAVEESVR